MSGKNDNITTMEHEKNNNSAVEPIKCNSPTTMSAQNSGVEAKTRIKSPSTDGMPPLKRQPSNSSINGDFSIKLQRRNSVQHQDIRRTNKKVSFSPFLNSRSKCSVDEAQHDSDIILFNNIGDENNTNTRYNNVTDSAENIRFDEQPATPPRRRKYPNRDLPPLLTTPSPTKRRPGPLVKYRSMSVVEHNALDDDVVLHLHGGSLDERHERVHNEDGRRAFSPPAPLNLHDIISSAPSSPNNIAFAPSELDETKAEALMRNCKTPTLTSSRGRFAISAPKTPQDLFFDFVNADLSRPTLEELFAQQEVNQSQQQVFQDEEMQNEKKQLERLRSDRSLVIPPPKLTIDSEYSNLDEYSLRRQSLASSGSDDQHLDSVEREYEEHINKSEQESKDYSPSYKLYRAASVFVMPRSSYHGDSNISFTPPSPVHGVPHSSYHGTSAFQQEHNHDLLATGYAQHNASTSALGALAFQFRQRSIQARSMTDPHSFYSEERRGRAQSFDMRQSSQWFMHKLAMVKYQTDQDLRVYLEELDQLPQRTTGYFPKKGIGLLRKTAETIIHTTLERMRDGEHRTIMKQLQKLNAHYAKRVQVLSASNQREVEPKLAGKRLLSRLVRKLIFIFSRCSRLLEFLRVQDMYATPTERKVDERVFEVEEDKEARHLDIRPLNLQDLRKAREGIVDDDDDEIQSRDSNSIGDTSSETGSNFTLASDDSNPPLEELPAPKRQAFKPPPINTLAVKRLPLHELKNESSTPTPTTPTTSSASPNFIAKVINKWKNWARSKKVDVSGRSNSATSTPTTTTPSTPVEGTGTFVTTPRDNSSTISQPASTFDLESTGSQSTTTSKTATTKTKKRSNSGIGKKRRASTPSPLKQQPPVAVLEILCRICEELVRSDQLEEHSKVCAIRRNIDMKTISCDERLKKLDKSIRKKISEIKKSKALRQLSEQEMEMLDMFSALARKAVAMPLNDDGAQQLETFVHQIGELLTPPPNPDEKSDTPVTPRTADLSFTVSIFAKRLDEVLRAKLETMRERIRLAPSTPQGGLSSSNRNSMALTNTGSPSMELPRTNSVRSRNAPRKTNITDFEILKPISRGAYGRVFLAKKKKTGDLYAIKVLKKRDMMRKNAMKRVIAERNIMVVADNDFVVRFYYSFSGKEYLYIVMDYCPGGDLFSLLQVRTYFEADMTRQYIAETVLALEHLHKKGIVHRDLKPDNLLINSDGHIKLTDFGLSEVGLIDHDPFFEDHYPLDDNGALLDPPGVVMAPPTPDTPLIPNPPLDMYASPKNSHRNSTFLSPPPTMNQPRQKSPNSIPSPLFAMDELQQDELLQPQQKRLSLQGASPGLSSNTSQQGHFAGTPDYLAPEILLGSEHSYAVDWWALGCIMFEFLFGCPPFNDDTPHKIFDNILSLNIPWPDRQDLPDDITDDCLDLIKKLLVLDPKKRINTAEQVKKHPFFKDVNWDEILKTPPSFIPDMTLGEEDTGHFGPRQGFYPVEDHNIDHDQCSESDNLTDDTTTTLSGGPPTRPSSQQGLGRSQSATGKGMGTNRRGDQHTSPGGKRRIGSLEEEDLNTTNTARSSSSLDEILSPTQQLLGNSLDFPFIQHTGNLAAKNKQMLQKSVLAHAAIMNNGENLREEDGETDTNEDDDESDVNSNDTMTSDNSRKQSDSQSDTDSLRTPDTMKSKQAFSQ
jgi:serine/threonine protein kinase/mRNA-degrading endonuclease RelE of RelBE toxin-antitoxin system